MTVLGAGDGAKLRPKLNEVGGKFSPEFNGELPFILIPPKLSSRSEEGEGLPH